MTTRLGYLLLFVFGLAAQLPAQAEPPAEAISPRDEVIRLFNGRDLTGFETWMDETGLTVRDGLLHILGEKRGFLATQQAYKDYRLITEFRWGERTWGQREREAKKSGITVHYVGRDGPATGYHPVRPSIEAQIIEGGVGDFWIGPGIPRAVAPTIPVVICELRTDARGNIFRDAGEMYWKAGGRRERMFDHGTVNWFNRDPDWKDVLGFRGQHDLESPDGQWTRLEVICDGAKIRVLVNGTLANEGFDAFPSAGKILFRSDLAEIFFRKIELWPLK
jgi:hypothetical protein